MARNYREVDHDQVFLVPPSLRDWLPADHLAWFVLEVVEQLDTSRLHARSRRGGVGREGYDPDMLLAVWLYASTQGISSSRKIERECVTDIAFRVLCAQDVPDHTVLARFRQAHEAAITDLFTQVLTLCVRQGLGRFGVIAIDGTKVKANASKSKTVSMKTLRELAAKELATAAATDRAEDAANAPGAHDDLPPGMGPGSRRAANIKRALELAQADIDAEFQPDTARVQARLAVSLARQAALREKVATRAAARAAGQVVHGRRENPAPEDTYRARRVQASIDSNQARLDRIAADRASSEAGERTTADTSLLKRNTTDPESRMMHTRGSGFIQGFNVQLAVSDDHLILAVDTTDQPNDQQQLIPMMAAVDAALTRLEASTERTDLRGGMIVADNGYLSAANLAAPGPDRLIAPGRGKVVDGQWKGSTGKTGSAISEAAATMRAKLAEPGNQELYNRRSVTVEPVNGHLKDRRGLRTFARRGLTAVQAEAEFAAMATNLLRLFTRRTQIAAI